MSKPSLPRVVAGISLASLMLVGGCVHRVVSATSSSGTSALPGVAPQLAVESFLRAANCVASDSCATKARDLETMSRLFGTVGGSILQRDPRPQVEKRMYALASLLACDDYRVEGENIVPGRLGVAVQLMVRLTQNGHTVAVPFIMVHARGGDWLVEQINMAPLTQLP